MILAITLPRYRAHPDKNQSKPAAQLDCGFLRRRKKEVVAQSSGNPAAGENYRDGFAAIKLHERQRKQIRQACDCSASSVYFCYKYYTPLTLE